MGVRPLVPWVSLELPALVAKALPPVLAPSLPPAGPRARQGTAPLGAVGCYRAIPRKLGWKDLVFSRDHFKALLPKAQTPTGEYSPQEKKKQKPSGGFENRFGVGEQIHKF